MKRIDQIQNMTTDMDDWRKRKQKESEVEEG